MAETSALERRLAREIASRKAAEQILESKSLELFNANQKLTHLKTSLESQVELRSQDLFLSERRFKSLVENAHDLIYIADGNGYVTYVNDVFEKRYGYENNKVLGTHFSDYIQEAHKEEIVNFYLDKAAKSQITSYLEVPVLKKNGEEIWLGQNVRFTYANNGFLKEAIIISRDITKKKLEEKQLLSTQLQLVSLIENMHEGVLFVSRHEEILLINSYFCDFFNITKSPSELESQNIDTIKGVIFSHINNPEKEVYHVLNTSLKKKIGQEIRLIDKRFINFDYIPIISDGIILGTLWQFTDITSQKTHDLSIRNSEEKYRGIIENMELGLLEVDNDGVIQKAYTWFCKMTGYEAHELIGKNAETLFLPPEYKSTIDENKSKRLKGEQSVYEIEIFKKNKERIWVIVSGAPFFNLDGEVKGSIGIHFDNTDQKRLQNEIIAAKEIAEKAQVAEQKFLASMSHEIRTPLNAVIGMSHLLNDTPLNNEQKEYKDMMQYSANLLRNLITDVLDFAKIESGELEISNKPFDLIGLLKTLHKTFELKVIGKPVDIKVKLPEVKKMIIGDETLINQVLYNLLGNAEKFTHTGEICLVANITEKPDNLLDVVFEVRDTGIGIDENQHEKIFKEFIQESRETSVKYGGTGLGLSITKRILEALGGEIKLESEKGKGTTFYVHLTLKCSKQDLVSEKVIDTVSLSQNSKILVLEDNIINQNYIKRILEKEGLEFDIVINGKEGFELAKKEKYDLIFMDISMPIMDGYESTIAIRNYSGPNKDTPIIALTATAMLNKKDKAFEIGMNDYMTKPFTPMELKAILSNYLGIKESSKGFGSGKFLSEGSLLNKETLVMFYDGDNEYATEMFEIFVRQHDEQIELLKSFLKESSFDEAQKIVHKMKPTFSMVGAPEIQETFQKLEDKLRFKDNIGINSYWLKSQGLLAKYMPAIHLELKRLKENN